MAEVSTPLLEFEEDIEIISKRNDDRNFRKFQIYMIFAFVVIGCYLPCMMLVPIYYRDNGFPGLGEFNVSLRFFFVIIGSASFAVFFRKLNFRKSFILFGFGMFLIPFSSFATSVCIDYDLDEDMCSRSGVYLLNAFAMSLGGVLGPCLILTSLLYAQVLSTPQSKLKFMSFATGMIMGASFFGLVVAMLILPHTSDSTLFGILSSFSATGIIVLSTFKDEDISAYTIEGSGILLNFKSIFNEIKNSEFSQNECILSALDGLNMGSSTCYIYRALVHALVKCDDPNDADFLKSAAMSCMGLGSLISGMLSMKYGSKRKNQTVLYTGLIAYVASLAFLHIGYHTGNYWYDVLSYAFCGLSTSHMQSGINLGISRNGYSLERLSIFRLASTTATSLSGVLGMFLLGYDGVMIFTIVGLLLAFLCYLRIARTKFFREDS